VDKLLEEALEPVEKFFRKTGLSHQSVFYNKGVEDKYVEEPRVKFGVNVRLDWEFALKPGQTTPEGISNDDIIDLIMKQIRQDVKELLVDGDVYSSDVLLKAMDGRNKRGKKPKVIAFPQISVYRELIPKKNVIEFTVHFNIYTEW
jgi:hypothetical protein